MTKSTLALLILLFIFFKVVLSPLSSLSTSPSLSQNSVTSLVVFSKSALQYRSNKFPPMFLFIFCFKISIFFRSSILFFSFSSSIVFITILSFPSLSLIISISESLSFSISTAGDRQDDVLATSFLWRRLTISILGFKVKLLTVRVSSSTPCRACSGVTGVAKKGGTYTSLARYPWR